MALSGKKRKFADAVISGKSKKDAAIMAGFSPATASQAASRLLKDPAIAAHIANGVEAKKAGLELPDDTPKFDVSQAFLHSDPKAFLLAAMNDTNLDPKQRIDAAKSLMPYLHERKGEMGKKEQAAGRAKNASAGRFASSEPPKLVVNNK